MRLKVLLLVQHVRGARIYIFRHRDGDLDVFFRMCILPSVNSLGIIVLIQLALKGLEFLENDSMFKEIIFYNSLLYVRALIQPVV